ncbi:oligoendopeptidase F [Fusibacter ferrireducens]|uniref:Oligopeptidase F n=1 Tax=Fusibacter ferrireducens TaxID=2785058 RepID=A0ABR9ZUB2_9FIRM|nr:oligoendopeptidase F [Fusibacter ferrireducens]MBF4694037.1 oligoendopeptidase F [Fusibacter ferrireducens]
MEINEKYKWDLSALFISDDAWEQAYSDVQKSTASIEKFKGRLLESPEVLLEAIQVSEQIERKLSDVSVYAHLKNDENTKASHYQGLYSRAESLVVHVSESMAFFVPEIMAADQKLVDQFISEHKGLEVYKHFFENLYRNKPHVRSEEIEMILAQMDEISSAPHNAYSMLLNADMSFEPVMDSEGVEHKITNGSYIPLMMSQDRTLRKNTFERYYKSYEAHINTIASLMQSEVKKNIFNSRVRGYASAREAALFGGNIPLSVPDKLIEAVNEALPAFHKYMKLRKEVMGLTELHLYDLYNPMIKEIDFKVTYDEAVSHVKEAVKPLGESYVKMMSQAFDERWIDVYETEGKRSGAYSSGTYDSKPYILLNHKDNVDSMFTLIHELGHSMHTYLSSQHQPYVYANYSIFVAEVASTTNEALLNAYLMETLEDESQKKYILNHYLEQFRGTIFRQTMFAEFERDIHAHVEAGGALTADYLCDHYLALNKKYFGEDVFIDEQIKYEWARIPHMYYNFYVYQYATGFSAAVALADQILTGGEAAVKKYLNFLSSGSKAYPIEVLRAAGADMETEKPVKNALSVFEKTVEAFSQLI